MFSTSMEALNAYWTVHYQLPSVTLITPQVNKRIRSDHTEPPVCSESV